MNRPVLTAEIIGNPVLLEAYLKSCEQPSSQSSPAYGQNYQQMQQQYAGQNYQSMQAQQGYNQQRYQQPVQNQYRPAQQYQPQYQQPIQQNHYQAAPQQQYINSQNPHQTHHSQTSNHSQNSIQIPVSNQQIKPAPVRTQIQPEIKDHSVAVRTRITESLSRDHRTASTLNKTPFADKDDMIERLLAYHVFQFPDQKVNSKVAIDREQILKDAIVQMDRTKKVMKVSDEV